MVIYSHFVIYGIGNYPHFVMNGIGNYPHFMMYGIGNYPPISTPATVIPPPELYECLPPPHVDPNIHPHTYKSPLSTINHQ